jgi:hypothetical protein
MDDQNITIKEDHMVIGKGWRTFDNNFVKTIKQHNANCHLRAR